MCVTMEQGESNRVSAVSTIIILQLDIRFNVRNEMKQRSKL